MREEYIFYKNRMLEMHWSNDFLVRRSSYGYFCGMWMNGTDWEIHDYGSGIMQRRDWNTVFIVDDIFDE